MGIELPNCGIVRLPLGVGQAVLAEVIRTAPLEGIKVMTNFSDVRIFLYTTPTNMCYSFDSLMGQAQEIFDLCPWSDHDSQAVLQTHKLAQRIANEVG